MTSKPWPRSQGPSLGLEILASFNITVLIHSYLITYSRTASTAWGIYATLFAKAIDVQSNKYTTLPIVKGSQFLHLKMICSIKKYNHLFFFDLTIFLFFYEPK